MPADGAGLPVRVRTPSRLRYVFSWVVLTASAAGCLLLLIAVRSSGAGAATTWWCLYAAGGDLWQTSGSEPERLTSQGHVNQPAAGPQGLAYIERQKNFSDLWFATSDNAPQLLTRNASAVIGQNHWTAQPVLEPDGRHAYVLGDFDKASAGVGNLAIWELDLQKGSFRQITHPPSYAGGDQDVTINPRAPQQIIFTRYQYGDNGQLIEGLNWLDTRVGRATPLAAPEVAMRQAAFSPDGSQLAFVQKDGLAENLYVAQLENNAARPQLNDIRQVASGVIAQPAWRGDGMAIGYLALTHGRFQLWSVTRDPGSGGATAFGQPHQLTSGPDLDATSRPIWLTEADAANARQWLQSR